MHDPAGVRVAERLARLQEQVARIVERELAALLYDRRQIGAAEVLHHDVRRVVRADADLVDANDVLALDRRRRPRLAAEPRRRRFVRRARRRQEFDRHRTAQRHIRRAEDDAHPAFADYGVNPVLTGDEVARARQRVRGHGRSSRA